MDTNPVTEEPEDRLGMTDEQWAKFQAHTHGYGDQDENGTDLSLMRENLKLTPLQRLDKLQAMVDFQWEVRDARIKAGLPAGVQDTE